MVPATSDSLKNQEKKAYMLFMVIERCIRNRSCRVDRRGKRCRSLWAEPLTCGIVMVAYQVN